MSPRQQTYRLACCVLALIQCVRVASPHPQSPSVHYMATEDASGQAKAVDEADDAMYVPMPATNAPPKTMVSSHSARSGRVQQWQDESAVCVRGQNIGSASSTSGLPTVLHTDLTHQTSPAADISFDSHDWDDQSDDDVAGNDSDEEDGRSVQDKTGRPWTVATIKQHTADKRSVQDKTATRTQHTADKRLGLQSVANVSPATQHTATRNETHLLITATTSDTTVLGQTGGTAISMEISVDIPCDSYVCDCSPKKKQAACCGRDFKLRHIPRVPDYVRNFRLWMANLFTLDRQKLENVSNFRIEAMDLRNNRIKALANDTFVKFRKLKNLDLGGNPITVGLLRDAFHSINLENFVILRLDDMYLGQNLRADFLAAFDNHYLQTLSMQRNGLTVFDADTFSGLRRIDKLFLTDNDIDSFVLNSSMGIQSLQMPKNSLNKLPVSFCMPNGESAFPNLFSLSLGNNPLRFISSTSLVGHCLPKLSKLDMSGSSASRLPNNLVADLPSLHTFMLTDMTVLNKYDPYCFNSSTLTSLSLVNNKVWQRGTVDPDNVFANTPALENLQLSGIKMDLPDDLLARALLGLSAIRTLRLADCRLGSIPSDTLWRLPHLTYLDLTNNHINAFNLAVALKNVSQLQTLILQANNINTINDTTLPPAFRATVRTLDVSKNPFDCTCGLLWFKTWADAEQRSGNMTIVNWPRQHYCNTPDRWKHTPVADYNPSYRDCHPLSVYIVVGGAGGGLLFLLLSTASLVYRFRWYLRYYVYRLRRRREYKYKLLRNEEDEPFSYSLYLAYSEQDLEWVMAEMLSLLETEAQQKVFLKNRDIVGGTVADNIVTNMDRSERVLLVLSDAYTREGWSGYEFEHVLYACMEQGKDVVVVLKGDVEAGRMTKSMRRMLTKGTFIQWHDTQEARAMFHEGLLVALRTGGDMQQVC